MQTISPDFQIRCPTSHCTGWVCFIEDEDAPFFGCGECGGTWDSKAQLDADIGKIAAKHPLHRAVYIQIENAGWQSAPFDKEPDDYCARVEEEPRGC